MSAVGWPSRALAASRPRLPARRQRVGAGRSLVSVDEIVFVTAYSASTDAMEGAVGVDDLMRKDAALVQELVVADEPGSRYRASGKAHEDQVVIEIVAERRPVRLTDAFAEPPHGEKADELLVIIEHHKGVDALIAHDEIAVFIDLDRQESGLKELPYPLRRHLMLCQDLVHCGLLSPVAQL